MIFLLNFITPVLPKKCVIHADFTFFSVAQDSPHLHQFHFSPAPTKTRSTSSQRAPHSALSNSLALCTSPQPWNLRKARTTQRQAPSQSLRGPHCSMGPPLRYPQAPAQTTPWRRLAQPQRLQSSRQTAQL